VRALPAHARGHQLSEARKQLSLDQQDTATTMGVGVARISHVKHCEATSFDGIARYVEAPPALD
jgi:uncharacterized protein YlxP (DUF503 family)